MPLFIMLTGFFSNPESKNYVKSTLNIALVFIIFQMVGIIPHLLLGGKTDIISFFTPRFHLWYIVALVWWRLLLKVVCRKLSVPSMFALSIIASLFCLGIAHSTLLAYDRTMSFMPFFVIGYMMRGKNFDEKIDKIPVVAYVVILLLIFGILLVENSIHERIFGILSGHYVISLKTLASIASVCKFIFTKMIWLIISFIVSICVYKLLPNVKVVAKEGKNTLLYYVYHPFLISLLWLILRHIGFQFSNLASTIIFHLVLMVLFMMSKISIFNNILYPIRYIEKLK